MAFLLLLAFLLMLYANPSLLVPSLEAVRPAQLAGMSAAAILVMQKTVSRKGIRFVWPESYLLIGLTAAFALSCFGAFWPNLAFETTLDFLKIAIIYFLIVNCVDTERRLWLTTATLVVAGVVPALGTLKKLEHEFSLKDELDSSWAVRPLALSQHRGEAAQLVALTLQGEAVLDFGHMFSPLVVQYNPSMNNGDRP